jgi:hypothetical protein
MVQSCPLTAVGATNKKYGEKDARVNDVGDV